MPISRFFRSLTFGVCALLISATSHVYAAQPIVSGVASVPLTGRCKDDVPRSAKMLPLAMAAAKKQALRSYTGSFSAAAQASYQTVSTQVENSLDEYLTNVTVVDQECDKGSKRFTLVISAQLNKSALDYVISQNSGNSGSSSGTGSLFVAVFLAREAASSTSFDVKVFTRTDTETIEDVDDNAAIQGDSVTFTGSSKTSQSITSGGSQTQRSDNIVYRVSRPRDLEDRVNQVFSTAGFEVIDAAEVAIESGGVFNLEGFIADFSSSDDVAAETRSSAYRTLREFDIPLFAMGTIDIGSKKTDPVSGNTTVFVSVSARVYDVSRRFARTVASVGPVQYSGEGPDATVAQRAALNIAAEKAASEIVAQLRVKGIK